MMNKDHPVHNTSPKINPHTGTQTHCDRFYSAATANAIIRSRTDRRLSQWLRAAAGTKARFLLTSRRDERAWLGDLPRRIEVPPMPMQERVQLAWGLAEKHGRRLTDVEAWRPLLRFTGGKPNGVRP